MASANGPVATEAPLVTPSAPGSSALPPSAPLEALAADAARASSLKRPRESTPTSPAAVTSGGLSHPDLSPNKLARLADSTRYSPAAPLTGQAALEDEQRRREEEARLHPPGAVSENPAQKALSLLRAQDLMSRKDDAPSTAQAAIDGLPRVVDPVEIPPANAVNAENQLGTSPQSATSAHSLGSPQVVHSPAPMDIDSRNDRPGYALQPEAQMEDKSGSMSYPGIMPPGGAMPAPPQRGMSLPMSSSQNPELAPRSPSSKKHKCPYCDTEFTRHHNLKSHLLTHSQEKPYVCQECSMRFRRLHDLKRHSKLHTGEKPHICPKCDRKFARGDALARHSKGAGGCAGRRHSTDSFIGDESYEGSMTEADDSAMTGVIYEGNEGDMTEEERRRLSLPSIKAQHVAGAPGAPESYAPHSRTYPPAGPRAGTAGGLYPPNVDRVHATGSNTSPSVPNSIGTGHTPNTSISSMPMSGGSSSLYSQGMTESPKPLSPAGLQPNQAGHDSAHSHRQRSPSLTTQLQQQQFGRRQPDLSTTHTAPQGPAPTTMPAHAPQQPAVTGAHSRTSSGPGHGQSGGSGDSSANLFSSEQGLWAYISALEERLSKKDEQLRQLGDKITALESAKQNHDAQMAFFASEINTLRSRIAAPRPQQQEEQEEQEEQGVSKH